MPVLTQKEFEEKKVKPKQEINLSKSGKPLASGVVDAPEELFKYYLLHPENGADGLLQNFEDVIIIEGKKYKRECKNGSVVTTEKVLADFLISKGYILMEKLTI